MLFRSTQGVKGGAQAIAACQKRTFDVVVTDLRMVPVDGLEVVRRLRDADPDATVVVVTAHGSVDVAVDAMRAAAADSLRLYPDPEAAELRAALAEHHGVRPEQVFVGNGSDEVLGHAFAALLTDADRVTEGERVLLLTVHNAKGLEFDAVAIAGLEEGLMPHASSLESSDQLEEERRLFYVALTRARDEVMLTAAAYRRRYDGAWGSAVSRFISEVPETLLEREEGAGSSPDRSGTRGGWSDRNERGYESRDRSGPPRRMAPTSRDRDAFGTREGAEWDSGDPGDKEPMMIPTVGGGRSASAKRAVGKRVIHEKFGVGTVLDAEGEGPDMKLSVRFTGAIKKVLARFVTGVGDGD